MHVQILSGHHPSFSLEHHPFFSQGQTMKKRKENIVLVITHLMWCGHHNSHGRCCPSPNSQGSLPQYTWDILGKLNGGGMKGSEARLVFSTMNASFRRIKIQKVVARGVVEGCPWLLREGQYLPWLLTGYQTYHGLCTASNNNYVRHIMLGHEDIPITMWETSCKSLCVG